MLCSKCSAVVHPIVAVDVDGTLGDWHYQFLRFASDYFGKTFDIRMYDGTGSLAEAMGVSLEDYRTCKLAFRQSGMKRAMRAFPGAAELTQAIKRMGAELWITTTRPYLQVGNVDPDTREWLNRFNIDYDHLLYDDDKYAELAQQVEPKRVVAVVDDEPSMYDRALDVGFHPILLARIHNRRNHRPVTADNLATVAFMVGERIEHWRKRNA